MQNGSGSKKRWDIVIGTPDPEHCPICRAHQGRPPAQVIPSDFFGPILYLSDEPKLWTVAIGLSEFRALHQVQWNLVMAACVLFMLPVIVLFFLAQRVFIEGVTLTGVKG